MHVLSAEIRLYAGWVQSLKEKRMIVQSLIDKVSHKFNVSIAEVAEQDIHQVIVLGVATVSNSLTHSEAVLQETVKFIQSHTDADITDVVIE